MTDEAPSGIEAEAEVPASSVKGSKLFDQDDVDRMIKDRLGRENIKELKRKASEYDQLQESQKTEHQRMTEKLAEFERKAAEAELRVLKVEVAASKGLSAVQAKRLQGSTKEELEADADEIIEAFGTKSSANGSNSRSTAVLKKTGVLPPGAEEAEAKDINEWMRQRFHR